MKLDEYQSSGFTEGGSYILKKCPQCEREIPIEEIHCPYCSSSFEVYESGFCARCNEATRAIENSKCAHCGSELENVHIASRPVGQGEIPSRQSFAQAVPPPPIPNIPYEPVPPQSQWQQGYPMYPPDLSMLPSWRPKDARSSLIYGIIGLFCLPIVFSALAIYYANKAKKEIAMRAGQVRVEGEGEATAGMILGIIGLALFVLNLVLISSGVYNLDFNTISFYTLTAAAVLF